MGILFIFNFNQDFLFFIFFIKISYTDLRGNFDYASLNSSNISNISKFSLFIMSDDFGIFFFYINTNNNKIKL